MSDHIQTNNSDLFIGISEKEMESASGGRSSILYMFYEDTNIYTKGMSDVNISQDNFSGNSRNETEYQFSRTTFVLFSLLGDGIQFNNLINSGGFLSRILRFF
ncbi:hypothetical protein [Sphaerospermopsis torques-reginae]|uniref:Uncharacterized protein n=1 Tax=Sphaerospermopsis torques-reginae ITEP-024 TaxID=984208 RepID=A0ABX8WX50_9CYAN|nr:hypothetical protein [Sphaerospermopsis torques-reginae]QYX30994.1 hypothetical protein K2F26_19395 [Sphaerospermopsis torques-reginae ITEP-024]